MKMGCVCMLYEGLYASVFQSVPFQCVCVCVCDMLSDPPADKPLSDYKGTLLVLILMPFHFIQDVCLPLQ